MFQAPTSKFTPNKFIKVLSFIHLGLLSGLVFFLMIAIFSTKEAMAISLRSDVTLLYVYPFIAIGAVVMSFVFSSALVKKAQQKDTLRSMLIAYQTAIIVRFFCVESAAFIGIIFYMMTNNAAFLAIVVLLILFLILWRPSLSRVESELELRGELRNQFLRYDEAVD